MSDIHSINQIAIVSSGNSSTANIGTGAGNQFTGSSASTLNYSTVQMTADWGHSLDMLGFDKEASK